MKMLTAYTSEIDDVEVAVAEILGMLDLDNNLETNSVGIINCYQEFIDSGVLKAVCDSLPFDVVGMTTFAGGAGSGVDLLMLNVAVLTGEDVKFSAAASDSLIDEQETPVERAFSKASAGLNGDADMLFVFIPFINRVGGERVLDVVDRVSGGIPAFGSVAIDHTDDHQLSYTIYNGEASKDSLAIVLASGNINPHYFMIAIPEENAQKQKAIITRSENSILMGVNDKSLVDYMGTLGLTVGDGTIEGLSTIPIVLDYNDGSLPVTRAIYLVDEDGNAVCSGRMPLGATLAFGSLDREDVIAAAHSVVKNLLGVDNVVGALVFSCLSRSQALEADALAELKTLSDDIGDKLQYITAYSGGEICPVAQLDGALLNRFHNFTLIACVFTK